MTDKQMLLYLCQKMGLSPATPADYAGPPDKNYTYHDSDGFVVLGQGININYHDGIRATFEFDSHGNLLKHRGR